MRSKGSVRTDPVNALCCRGRCPEEAPSLQDLEVIGGLKSIHSVCRLVSLPHQNVLMQHLSHSLPSLWGGDTSSVPSRGVGGSYSCRLASGGPRAMRGGGPGPRPRELDHSQCVSEAWPGSLPAEPGIGRSTVPLQRGVDGTSGFRLHWAWQEAPPPMATNKAITPRVELWELESKVALGGNESRQAWPGATWQEPSMPKDVAGLHLARTCTYR